MLKLTAMDGREILLNADLIERVESVPETVITLTTQKKILVRESMDEVLARFIAYKQEIASRLPG